MNSDLSIKIIERFYIALDTLVVRGDLRGINTYCNLYNIDRRNIHAQRKQPTRGWFQVSWLYPLVVDFGVSANWLITGTGLMFTKQN